MTACEYQRGAPCRIGRLFVALLVGGAILRIVLPPLNDHAVASHGEHAQSAWTAEAGYDPDDPNNKDDGRYEHYTLPDGREAHILRLPEVPGGHTTWAVVIVGGACAYCVTAFLTQNKRQPEKIRKRGL
jgi:hypothetical protein